MNTTKCSIMDHLNLVRHLSNPAVAYITVASAVVALLCYNIFFKTRKGSGDRLPVWAPLEIALTAYLVSAGGPGRRIYSAIRCYDGSLFGISKKHQVLVGLPNLDRFMSQGHNTLEHIPTQISLMIRVFGSKDTPEYIDAFNLTVKELLSVVEKEFVAESASTAALERGNIHQQMSSLVTFTDARENMQLWERSANIRVIEKALPGQSGVVEADLMCLMRDFGAAVAIPILYGKDFMQRNPNLLEDFWKFDNDLFPLLMVGVPEWTPFKMVKEGFAARAKLISAMDGLYRRIDQYQKGESVDFEADMSDIGVARERNKVYAKYNVPFRYRADMDFPFLWGQNGNTQPLLFWYMLYTCSTSGLVDRFRQEITQWIKLSSKGGLVEIESVDINSIYRECPLMKSALFETFRLCSEPTSIRRVAKPLTVVDGEYTHQIQPGSFISAPYGLAQNDPSVFPEPETFMPERFIELDAKTGKRTARYGRLRPWSVGSGSCKGRTFAEKEILTIAACMISMWDIQPSAGEWKIPYMIPGTGAKRPLNDVRVLLRRKVWTETI